MKKHYRVLVFCLYCLFSFSFLDAVAVICTFCGQSDCDGNCDSSWQFVSDDAREALTSLQSQLSSFEEISREHSTTHSHSTTHPHYASSQDGDTQHSRLQSGCVSPTQFNGQSLPSQIHSNPASLLGYQREVSEFGSANLPFVRGSAQALHLSLPGLRRCLPLTIPPIPPFQMQIDQENLEHWLTGTTGLMDQLSEAYETCRQERQTINQRIKKIQARSEELQLQGVQKSLAYDQANLDIPNVEFTLHDYPHLKLLDQVLLHMTSIMKNQLADDLLILAPALDSGQRAYSSTNSQFAALINNLMLFNSHHLHLVANHVSSIISLLTSVSNNQFSATAELHLENGNPENLLPSTNQLFLSINQYFQTALAQPQASITVISPTGTISPINDNNLMIFSIPSGTDHLTILMSPSIGVFASLNPDAIYEYVCRFLGILFVNNVTISVRMATAISGVSGTSKPSIEK